MYKPGIGEGITILKSLTYPEDVRSLNPSAPDSAIAGISNQDADLDPAV